MKQLLTLMFSLVIAISLTACGGDDHKDHDHKDHGHKDHKHKDGEHKDGEHKDEASGKDHDDDHHGDPIDLGKVDAGGVSIAVTLYGHVHAGEEAVFDVAVSGTDGEPNAVRAWVGVESGEGSLKSKLDIEDGKFHGHCDTPDPLPADSKVWIEVETSDGKKVTGSFTIKE